MLLNAIYAQITLLILTGLWIAFSKRRTTADTAIKVIATILLCAGLGVGGVWFYPPLGGLLIATLIFVGLFVVHLRKTHSQTTLLRSIFCNTPLLILIPLGSFLLWQGTTGRFETKRRCDRFELTFQVGRRNLRSVWWVIAAIEFS